MNGYVEKVLNDIILKAKNDIPPMIAINAIHYSMAMVTGMRRVKVVSIDGQKTPVNNYGITFGNSGRGKDYSASLALEIIEKVIDLYNIKKSQIMVKINDTEVIFPALEYKEGTASGFHQDRQFLDTVGVGSTNVRVEELVSFLKSGNAEEVLNMLTESWQEGSNQAKSYKSYQAPKIQDVPCNALLYSSPTGFRTSNNKHFNNFVEILANGLARRSFVVFDDTEVELENEPTTESLRQYAEDIKESRANIVEMQGYVKDLFESNPKGEILINISIEAELEFKKYEVLNKNFVYKNPLLKDAVKAEMLNRSYKTRRLAALYAYFDGSHDVSQENIHDAIEWADMCHQSLIIALNAETPAEKIYDYLLKVGRYSSQTDIIKYYQMSAQEFKGNIEEVHTVAYDNGSVLQTKVFDKEAKVVKYNLVAGKQTTHDKLICSAANHQANGYVSRELAYPELEGLVRGAFGTHYSAGTFLNSHRTKDNYIKRQNLIIFDVDEITTIEDALIQLQDYRGFIATTRNHQKQKDAKAPCDRYRIVLISKYEFNLDHEEFKETLSNLARFLNIMVDFPVIEPARMYFAHPESEVIYLDGEELVDLRDYMPDTREVETTIEAVTYADRANVPYDGPEQTDGLDKYFLQSICVGSRNNGLHAYMLALIDKKNLDFETAKSKTLHLNSKLIEPLTEAELERTCFSSIARK